MVEKYGKARKPVTLVLPAVVIMLDSFMYMAPHSGMAGQWVDYVDVTETNSCDEEQGG
jgi:hypothetical protein